MNLAETSAAINQELVRLGVDYDVRSNRDGLVCRTEPGRNPPAVRLGSGWFSGVFNAEVLLDYLRCLRPGPTQCDRDTFWESGRFWTDLQMRNIQMLEAREATK